MSPRSLHDAALSAPAAEAAHRGSVLLALDVAATLESPLARRRRAAVLLDALLSSAPVAVRLHNSGASRAGQSFALICDFLAQLCRRAGVDAAALELTVTSTDIAPQVAWQVRTRELGRGRINVIVDAAADAGFWRSLWRLRGADVVPVCWPLVRSPSALLSAECATDVVPGIGLQAPQDSAWSVRPVALDGFIDRQARLDHDGMAAALRRAVRAADRQHDALRWPTPASRQDAWFNRRVALTVHGIGNVVQRARLDPADPTTLSMMTALMRDVRRTVDSASVQLMRQDGLLPAIEACNPCHRIAGKKRRRSWQRRWQNAVHCAGLRHRNLLVMSPWQLLPADAADARYTNLMPLLAFADACAFRRDSDIGHWSFPVFERFYRTLCAIAHQSAPSVVVAERL